MPLSEGGTAINDQRKNARPTERPTLASSGNKFTSEFVRSGLTEWAGDHDRPPAELAAAEFEMSSLDLT